MEKQKVSPHMLSKVKRSMEPPSIQYGAWDNPSVSIFSALSQDPMPNMLDDIKQLPKGTSDGDNDACPMVMEGSNPTSAAYQLFRHQLEEMVAEQNSQHRPMEQQKRDDQYISVALAKEKKKDIVDKSLRKQLHRNVPELRDLMVEIERASTALDVKYHMEREQRERCSDQTRYHNEALEEQERLRIEIETEKEQRRQKSVNFGNQLVDQIKEDRIRRQQQQQADYEAGRKERYESEKQCEIEKRQEVERRHNHRKHLKTSMDDFADFQRRFHKMNTLDSQSRPEKSVLDALGPQTADLIAKSLEARNEKIATRGLVSARLGFQLSRIKHEKDAREKLILGLLVREHKAKEDGRAMQQAEIRMKKKQQIQEELLGQRIEQDFYREKSKDFDKLIPYDETCFGERQHQESTSRNKAMYRLQIASYEVMSQMIIENDRRRAQAMEEQRKMSQAISDMQTKQDDMVREERIRLLSNEPLEVLQAMRLSTLTNEEVQKFNLKNK